MPLQIVSPMPMPRRSARRACQKRSNSRADAPRARCPARCPTPRSAPGRVASLSARTTTRPPACVNFPALPIRLSSTCEMRPRSACTRRSARGKTTCKRDLAFGEHRSSTPVAHLLEQIVHGRDGSDSSARCPACRRVMSSRSLINAFIRFTDTPHDLDHLATPRRRRRRPRRASPSTCRRASSGLRRSCATTASTSSRARASVSAASRPPRSASYCFARTSALATECANRRIRLRSASAAGGGVVGVDREHADRSVAARRAAGSTW